MSQLIDLIFAAHDILLFTGAGISTTSGIPDFRGPNGVWKTRQPVYYQDFMASESARIESWDQKLESWDAFRDAEPNDVHHAIADLEREGRIRSVVTQNIDGLHAKAGTSSERLVEIHGTNALVECQTCGERDDPQPHYDAFRETRIPPRCKCGGLLKSATISFGQSLREADLQRAHDATEEADLVISLGSTLSVHPAASIPVMAAQRGVPYIVINRGSTDHDGQSFVTLRLEGDVTEIFPPAVEHAQRGRIKVDDGRPVLRSSSATEGG
jgi:NAD-dependent deacetylase